MFAAFRPAAGDGTATAKRLISDEEQLREFEMMELQEEFAENELRWRRKGDYKAAERANAAEGWYSLRLLYKHKAEA